MTCQRTHRRLSLQALANGKFTWEVLIFRPNGQFAMAAIRPGMWKEYDTEREARAGCAAVLRFLGLPVPRGMLKEVEP